MNIQHNSMTVIPCSLMRGGTSKGLVVEAKYLPPAPEERDRLLMQLLGSPDPRQIDGLGGAHPLTSKVAVVSPSTREGIDVDYLFLQVWPDRPEVSDSQNCGNMLAAVAPFAIEEGIVAAGNPHTDVRIWMVNTDTAATARVQTPSGSVTYAGSASIDGVAGSHAPINITFEEIAGSSCGELLPTGNVIDTVDGIDVTCIDNGMPVVCLRAADFGLTGTESPAEIESRSEVKERIESIRIKAGALMNLGDVTSTTVPKMSLLAPPRAGGVISTRTFIPHRVHEAIGVFGAVSVATACCLPGSVAHEMAQVSEGDESSTIDVEHPTGYFTVSLRRDQTTAPPVITSASLLRTARLLMRGDAYALGDQS